MAQRFAATSKSAEMVKQILREAERTAKTPAVRKVISNGAKDVDSRKDTEPREGR